MDYDAFADLARPALIIAAARRSLVTYGELARAIDFPEGTPGRPLPGVGRTPDRARSWRPARSGQGVLGAGADRCGCTCAPGWSSDVGPVFQEGTNGGHDVLAAVFTDRGQGCVFTEQRRRAGEDAHDRRSPAGWVCGPWAVRLSSART